VPKTVLASTTCGQRQPLHSLWLRRHTTKFNGVSYITQRGAEALYTPEGKAQVAALIEHYMGNAKILREAAASIGSARLRRHQCPVHLVLHSWRAD
jgi:LL-diaminopimelate aminotransferase